MIDLRCECAMESNTYWARCAAEADAEDGKCSFCRSNHDGPLVECPPHVTDPKPGQVELKASLPEHTLVGTRIRPFVDEIPKLKLTLKGLHT